MLIRFLDCFDEQKIYKEPISAVNVKLFLERYGRNDFQALGSPMEVQHSLGYLMKYIEKSGERLRPAYLLRFRRDGRRCYLSLRDRRSKGYL